MSDRYKKLEHIANLKEKGVLSEEEFAAEKSRILSEKEQPSLPPATDIPIKERISFPLAKNTKKTKQTIELISFVIAVSVTLFASADEPIVSMMGSFFAIFLITYFILWVLAKLLGLLKPPSFSDIGGNDVSL